MIAAPEHRADHRGDPMAGHGLGHQPGLRSMALRRPIATPRLTLRPLDVSDAENWATEVSNPSVAWQMADLTLPFHPGDAFDAILALAEAGSREIVHAVERATAPGLIGMVRLSRAPGKAMLSYWLAADQSGQGLMGEALHAALAALGAIEPDLVITTRVMSDNGAALKLMNRLGFAMTGVTDIYAGPRGRMVTTLILEARAGSFAG